MFIRYLNDMKSWILFYMIPLGFVNLLIWLDNGLSVQPGSVVYLNLLLLLILVFFLIWRYRKETKHTMAIAALIEDMDEDWIERLPAAHGLRDEMTNEALRAANVSFSRKWSENNEAHILERDYVTSWVHEAKAPLTAMKLVIDANRSDEAMKKMEAEWLRLYLLVDRQLYISRLPSLESDFILEKSPIQRLVSDEVRELASWFVEKNLEVDLAAEDVEVVTDSKWCRFILRQVLTNAVKYSPEGGTITISTAVAATGHAVLTLKDEGPGIPPHELPRLFDKGFTGGAGRLHNAATGLGLYLAQTVAGKIGITIAVQSERMQGTTVQLTFSIPNDLETIRT